MLFVLFCLPTQRQQNKTKQNDKRNVPVERSSNGRQTYLQLQLPPYVRASAKQFVLPLPHQIENFFSVVFSQLLLATTVLVLCLCNTFLASCCHPLHSILDAMLALWMLSLHVPHHALDLVPLAFQLHPQVLFVS